MQLVANFGCLLIRCSSPKSIIIRWTLIFPRNHWQKWFRKASLQSRLRPSWFSNAVNRRASQSGSTVDQPTLKLPRKPWKNINSSVTPVYEPNVLYICNRIQRNEVKWTSYNKAVTWFGFSVGFWLGPIPSSTASKKGLFCPFLC